MPRAVAPSSRLASKLISLFVELLCFASFVACGLVVGFCAGRLFVALFRPRRTELEELGFMFNGAILGAGAGLVFALAALRAVAARRNIAVLPSRSALPAQASPRSPGVFNAW